jgi:hypothetical protein
MQSATKPSNNLAIFFLVMATSVSILDFFAGLGLTEEPGASVSTLVSIPMGGARPSMAASFAEDQNESRVAKDAGKEGSDSVENKVEGNLGNS